MELSQVTFETHKANREFVQAQHLAPSMMANVENLFVDVLDKLSELEGRIKHLEQQPTYAGDISMLYYDVGNLKETMDALRGVFIPMPDETDSSDS